MAGQVTRVEGIEMHTDVFVEKPGGKNPLTRPGHK